MRRSYNALIIILAAISIILSMLDINGIISIVQKPYIYVDASIWLVFVFDYFYGLMAAKDKRFYFRTHIWDLLAIIPLNALFSFFPFQPNFQARFDAAHPACFSIRAFGRNHRQAPA